jgi:hypothetical protein
MKKSLRLLLDTTVPCAPTPFVCAHSFFPRAGAWTNSSDTQWQRLLRSASATFAWVPSSARPPQWVGVPVQRRCIAWPAKRFQFYPFVESFTRNASRWMTRPAFFLSMFIRITPLALQMTMQHSYCFGQDPHRPPWTFSFSGGEGALEALRGKTATVICPTASYFGFSGQTRHVSAYK